MGKGVFTLVFYVSLHGKGVRKGCMGKGWKGGVCGNGVSKGCMEKGCSHWSSMVSLHGSIGDCRTHLVICFNQLQCHPDDIVLMKGLTKKCIITLVGDTRQDDILCGLEIGAEVKDICEKRSGNLDR